MVHSSTGVFCAELLEKFVFVACPLYPLQGCSFVLHLSICSPPLTSVSSLSAQRAFSIAGACKGRGFMEWGA